jgi:hypothetical protein
MSALELVVARHTEPLNWLERVPRSITKTVLDKNAEAPLPGAIRLPNVGREAHSYLHFIVARYDQLSEATVFCQGHPFDHAYDFHTTLRRVADRPEHCGDFLWLGHVIDTDDAHGGRLFSTWSKNGDRRGLDLNGFHRQLFGTDGPNEYTFHLGAQFIVRRHVIRRRTLEFWQRALALSGSFPDAAHCYERTWDRIFGVDGIDKVWLHGRKTVYLKPIRRLQQTTQLS